MCFSFFPFLNRTANAKGNDRIYSKTFITIQVNFINLEKCYTLHVNIELRSRKRSRSRNGIRRRGPLLGCSLGRKKTTLKTMKQCPVTRDTIRHQSYRKRHNLSMMTNISIRRKVLLLHILVLLSPPWQVRSQQQIGICIEYSKGVSY